MDNLNEIVQEFVDAGYLSRQEDGTYVPDVKVGVTPAVVVGGPPAERLCPDGASCFDISPLMAAGQHPFVRRSSASSSAQKTFEHQTLSAFAKLVNELGDPSSYAEGASREAAKQKVAGFRSDHLSVDALQMEGSRPFFIESGHWLWHETLTTLPPAAEGIIRNPLTGQKLNVAAEDPIGARLTGRKVAVKGWVDVRDMLLKRQINLGVAAMFEAWERGQAYFEGSVGGVELISQDNLMALTRRQGEASSSRSAGWGRRVSSAVRNVIPSNLFSCFARPRVYFRLLGVSPRNFEDRVFGMEAKGWIRFDSDAGAWRANRFIPRSGTVPNGDRFYSEQEAEQEWERARAQFPEKEMSDLFVEYGLLTKVADVLNKLAKGGGAPQRILSGPAKGSHH